MWPRLSPIFLERKIFPYRHSRDRCSQRWHSGTLRTGRIHRYSSTMHMDPLQNPVEHINVKYKKPWWESDGVWVDDHLTLFWLGNWKQTFIYRFPMIKTLRTFAVGMLKIPFLGQMGQKWGVCFVWPSVFGARQNNIAFGQAKSPRLVVARPRNQDFRVSARAKLNWLGQNPWYRGGWGHTGLERTISFSF